MLSCVLQSIDNEATFAALISGRSDNALVAQLISLLSLWEEGQDVSLWLDRVASPSNPSDAPSRGDVAGLPIACRVQVDPLKPVPLREG